MTNGEPISGSVERRADGTFLVRVEVEGVQRTFHFLMKRTQEDTETMLKDELPEVFRNWLAAAGGLDRVLETLFKPYAVATQTQISFATADVVEALDMAHHKIGSGIAEAEAIRARLPLS